MQEFGRARSAEVGHRSAPPAPAQVLRVAEEACEARIARETRRGEGAGEGALHPARGQRENDARSTVDQAGDLAHAVLVVAQAEHAVVAHRAAPAGAAEGEVEAGEGGARRRTGGVEVLELGGGHVRRPLEAQAHVRRRRRRQQIGRVERRGGMGDGEAAGEEAAGHARPPGPATVGAERLALRSGHGEAALADGEPRVAVDRADGRAVELTGHRRGRRALRAGRIAPPALAENEIVAVGAEGGAPGAVVEEAVGHGGPEAHVEGIGAGRAVEGALGHGRAPAMVAKAVPV